MNLRLTRRVVPATLLPPGVPPVMASDKKRNKQAKAAKKATRPAGKPFRHPDGDRRRRGGMTADQGTANKKLMQQFEVAPPLPDEPGGA